MDLSDLTPQQAQELAERLRPTLGYLVRLTNRMQQRGWAANDPAYAAAWAARDAMHELCVRLHYVTRAGHAGIPMPVRAAEAQVAEAQVAAPEVVERMPWGARGLRPDPPGDGGEEEA